MRCPTCTIPVSTPGKCSECIDGPCLKCGRYVETNEFGFCVQCLTWAPWGVRTRTEAA